VFANSSRYRTVPDTVVEDAAGRIVTAKDLRLLPEAGGTFAHTVAQGERLDTLAFKYYRQSRKWWRICDANSDLLSPLELVGSTPVLTVRLPLATAGAPDWAAAARLLVTAPGVESYRFVDDVRIVPERRTIDGRAVFVNVEHHELAVLVTHNELVLSTPDLSALLASAGFTVGRPEALGQIGQAITIPPDSPA
jgi:hypothetical protein